MADLAHLTQAEQQCLRLPTDIQIFRDNLNIITEITDQKEKDISIRAPAASMPASNHLANKLYLCIYKSVGLC